MTTELDAEELADYLYRRGDLAAPTLTHLAGGVSGETVLVQTPPLRLIVKRALDRLLVAGEWLAKPERAMTEAAAIELLHTITPEKTPRLCDSDPARNLIVMTAAPSDWVNWKEVLLGQVPDPSAGLTATARALGAVLATWHEQTWHDPAVAARFSDYEALHQLRIAPFHLAVAAAHPAVAPRIEQCAEELLTRRDCLVHGDFSPKNILVGEHGLMVLDFEVAHFGAPAFDLAFMLCHLTLKALHQPAKSETINEAAAAFTGAYHDALAPRGVPLLGWHTACFLLARVDGLSPAGYLSAATAVAVRRLALDVLAGEDLTQAQFWQRVRKATP